ncbi:dTDP-4-dehydrorhamnose reductase [Halosimplex rubrum]|uniref:dTDP-4-dehydrorhamnose reductase n=1 Tax=Halosimplex rubrum TaxID=869889 RepID=A0A7D5NZH1_9EURY|nr:dTDP-4-dehydrorhamnose reductase [Halosimplex rubrum]QLH76877.1 dTDP-4-dehydrorhamnose reductase [Halosimplex rubrum]
MELMVAGASGLLGSNVVATARERGIETVGTYHSDRPSFAGPLESLDIRDADRTRELVEEYRPDAVVNCAAMTDVDGCESEPNHAMEVNADAPGDLAAVCTDYDTDLVHVSTDYVFDGEEASPYNESAEMNPRQVYGETKRAGERAVLQEGSDPLVTRLSFVYGSHESSGQLTGFPAWIRDQLATDEPITLFTDQYVTPTRAGHAAAVLLDLIEEGESGLVHVASRSCVTPYTFGDEIRRRMDASEGLLARGTMDDLDRPAPRPEYTCLDVSRVEDVLGRPQPELADDLSALATTVDGW